MSFSNSHWIRNKITIKIKLKLLWNQNKSASTEAIRYNHGTSCLLMLHMYSNNPVSETCKYTFHSHTFCFPLESHTHKIMNLFFTYNSHNILCTRKTRLLFYFLYQNRCFPNRAFLMISFIYIENMLHIEQCLLGI